MEKKTAEKGVIRSENYGSRVRDACGVCRECVPPDMEIRTAKRNLLLHSCCGPCSTTAIERLAKEYRLTVFFYNPNITDREEYEKRRLAQIQFIDGYNQTLEEEDKVSLIEGEYITEDFFAACGHLAGELEGGRRCEECFRLRLKRTAQVAANTGNQIFGTTLTVSPHKSFMLVSAIGMDLAREYGLEFLNMDFKKKNGYQRSIELSKEYCLYRQSYCGCVYSKDR